MIFAGINSNENAMETKEKIERRGGYRPNAGRRKTAPEDRMVQFTMTLTPEAMEKLAAIGETLGVNRSYAIEKLIHAMYYFVYNDIDDRPKDNHRKQKTARKKPEK